MYKSEHLITSKHYLVICSIAFAVGIFIFVCLNSFIIQNLLKILFYAASGLLFLLVVVLILKAFKIKIIRLKLVLLPLLIILCLALGILRIAILENREYNTLLNYTDKEVWLYGQISDTPHLSSSKLSRTFELRVEQVNQDPNAKGTVAVYIPFDRCQDIALGEKICCWTALSAPQRDDPDDNFDYYTRLRGKSIFLIGKTKNINRIDYETSFSLWAEFKEFGLNLRNIIAHRIDGIFSTDPQSAAILKGILLGDKSGFTEETYKDFSNAGISHIVAVSGLHLSILFSFLMLLLNGKASSKKKWVLIVSIPFILIFTAISAFSLSVCRAAIMLLVSITAALANENYDPVSSLFLSLDIILAIHPYSIFSKSLILSFSATLGIFVYYNYFNQIFSKILSFEKLNPMLAKTSLCKIRDTLSSSFALTASSFIGTAYFLILLFGKFSKVQFLTNLWCIPLVSIIFCFGYIAVILMGIFPCFTSNIIKPVLYDTVRIIKLTIFRFGRQEYSMTFSDETIQKFDFFIYLGAALFIYFTLKLICDIINTKKFKLRSKTLKVAK